MPNLQRKPRPAVERQEIAVIENRRRSEPAEASPGRPILRITCPSCLRSVPVMDVTTTDRGIALTCPSCREPSFLEPPSSLHLHEQKDDLICPKCLRSIRTGSLSCPKCGLIFSLWEKRLAGSPAAGPKTRIMDPQVETLWHRILQDPDAEAPHEAFLDHCREHHCLDLAAHRYRELLYRHPGARLGARYRDRIILLAQFEHRPARKPRFPLPRFSGIKIVLFLGLAALLWGLVLARLLISP